MCPIGCNISLFSETIFLTLTVDVSGDHETRLGNWHHGRVAKHGDYKKTTFEKKFMQFLAKN